MLAKARFSLLLNSLEHIRHDDITIAIMNPKCKLIAACSITHEKTGLFGCRDKRSHCEFSKLTTLVAMIKLMIKLKVPLHLISFFRQPYLAKATSYFALLFQVRLCFLSIPFAQSVGKADGNIDSVIFAYATTGRFGEFHVYLNRHRSAESSLQTIGATVNLEFSRRLKGPKLAEIATGFDQGAIPPQFAEVTLFFFAMRCRICLYFCVKRSSKPLARPMETSMPSFSRTGQTVLRRRSYWPRT